eukprot:TRINITY_DN474_c1_g1_i1.p1 TRINITY_DN474_c1_g1~~TRINITY_DN474_c1_g1_i1.p1  ORF type:complete len:299 (+),score=68.12 TRINITY_DN474_c1_g1_i1:51-899(+)
MDAAQRPRSKSISGETWGRLKVDEAKVDEKKNLDMMWKADKLELEMKVAELTGEVERLRAKCVQQSAEFMVALQHERMEKCKVEHHLCILREKTSMLQARVAAMGWKVTEGEGTTTASGLKLRYFTKQTRFNEEVSYNYYSESESDSDSDDTASTADTEPITPITPVTPTDDLSPIHPSLRADLFDLFTEYLTTPTSDTLTPPQVRLCWQRMETTFHLPPEPCPTLPPDTRLSFTTFLKVMVRLAERVRERKEAQTKELQKQRVRGGCLKGLDNERRLAATI